MSQKRLCLFCKSYTFSSSYERETKLVHLEIHQLFRNFESQTFHKFRENDSKQIVEISTDNLNDKFDGPNSDDLLDDDEYGFDQVCHGRQFCKYPVDYLLENVDWCLTDLITSQIMQMCFE